MHAAPLPPFPHPEPRPYHLVLRTWNYRLWKPVLGIAILLLAMFIVMPIVMLPVLALGVWAEGGDFLAKFEAAATLSTVDPAALLYLNLVLGSMVFVTWFIVRVVHRMRPRWLMSVMPRIRWKLFLYCLPARLRGPARPGRRRGAAALRRRREHRWPRQPLHRDVRGHRDRGDLHDTPAGGGGGVRLPRLPDAGRRRA